MTGGCLHSSSAISLADGSDVTRRMFEKTVPGLVVKAGTDVISRSDPWRARMHSAAQKVEGKRRP